MRTAFVNTLIEIAEEDKNIYLLTGDLGFSVLEKFAQKFPERFINCGVAEQNMMGLAAGLALSSKKPYVYSIIPFVTMRCFEQIRNDVCYQNLDVKIIGIGSGLAYGSLGATHHAIEDIAILRALPNMTLLSPADPIETRELVLKSYQTKNPTYLRLNKSGEKILYDSSPEIEIGKPSILKEGKEGVIISTGILTGFGITIIEKLKEKGYNFKLISLHTLKPINKETLFKELVDSKLVFTLEEHNIIGGLGSAVAEILAESNWQGKFKRIGIPDQYCSKVGEREYLRQYFGLVQDKIINKIYQEIKKINQ
jgi:transketolase